MRALTDRQRAFVDAMLETGGRDHTLAAKMAGYSPGGSEGARRVTAYRLAHDPKVLAAIREEADHRLHSGAILGASALFEIAADPMHKDRRAAAVELLNRGGLMLATVTKHEVEITDNRDRMSILARIEQIAAANGLDATKLLNHTPGTALPTADIVDAEYAEVLTSEEVEAGREGLEDLL